MLTMIIMMCLEKLGKVGFLTNNTARRYFYYIWPT